MTYRTADEIRFIDNLGNHSPKRQKNPVPLLKGYLKGCKKRKNWEGLDKTKIVSHARKMLKALK